jgi:hypothetical protein
MANPWDVPPTLPESDMSFENLYRAVGEALSTWEGVENELAQLFAAFVGAEANFKNWEATIPAIRAYGSVISFNGRADMIDAAAKGYFFVTKTVSFDLGPSIPETRYADLMKACRGFAARRNDIAHGMALLSLNEAGRVTGVYLQPGLFASKKNPLGKQPSYSYTTSQIRDFIKHFQELSFQVQIYRGELERGDFPSLEKPQPK